MLDCLVYTPSALIGIESKRFEPFRSRRSSSLSDAYWRPVWGGRMGGYQRIRDGLRDGSGSFAHLDAAQLFKHALALRSDVPRRGGGALRPILFYVYAEPEVRPASGEAVDERAIVRHREEIETFGATVADDEVRFVACPWGRLLDAWADQPDSRIRTHAKAVTARFSPVTDYRRALQAASCAATCRKDLDRTTGAAGPAHGDSTCEPGGKTG